MERPDNKQPWRIENRIEPQAFSRVRPPRDNSTTEAGFWGTQILENSEHTITTTAFVGTEYLSSREAARVQITLNPVGDQPTAQIVKFQEHRFAKGTKARIEALQMAEWVAASKGVETMRLQVNEFEFTQQPTADRISLIRDLQLEGYLVRYHTRTDHGERVLRPAPGRLNPDKVEGEPLTIDAIKNLRQNPLQLPETQVNDRLDEQFKRQITHIESPEKAPETIELPQQVKERMTSLWEKSTYKDIWRHTVVQEHGGTLVENKNGDIVLDHEVKGDSGSVRLEFPVDMRRVIGVYHTHPYEDGTTGASFSGTDIASFLSLDESRISLVRSGDTVFALVKTDQSTTVKTEADYQAIHQEVDAEFRRALTQLTTMRNGRRDQADFTTAILIANLKACRKHQLSLYKGQAGKPLERINPS